MHRHRDVVCKGPVVEDIDAEMERGDDGPCLERDVWFAEIVRAMEGELGWVGEERRTDEVGECYKEALLRVRLGHLAESTCLGL